MKIDRIKALIQSTQPFDARMAEMILATFAANGMRHLLAGVGYPRVAVELQIDYALNRARFFAAGMGARELSAAVAVAFDTCTEPWMERTYSDHAVVVWSLAGLPGLEWFAEHAQAESWCPHCHRFGCHDRHCATLTPNV